MLCLAATRFTEETFRENQKFRERHSIAGCIYGSPTRISGKYAPSIGLLVLEMNNDRNRIEGVGLIRNCPRPRRAIYANPVFNLHAYDGKFRLDREELLASCPETLVALEAEVFRSKRHLKRQYGITVMRQEGKERAVEVLRAAMRDKYQPQQ